MVQTKKSITAHGYLGIYSKIKKEYFWVGRLWIQPYFVEIIVNADEKVIEKYL
jgi:REP element-mobilizing transposase RayT